MVLLVEDSTSTNKITKANLMKDVIPEYTVNDANKVLTVNNSGTGTEWVENIYSLNLNGTNLELKINGVIVSTVSLSDVPVSPEVIGNIVVDPTTLLLNENTTKTFNVTLDQAPTNTQVVSLSVDNANSTIDKTQLTFTSDDYDIPQTVIVTGVHDSSSYSNKNSVITLSSEKVDNITIGVTIKNIDTDPSIQVTSLERQYENLEPLAITDTLDSGSGTLLNESGSATIIKVAPTSKFVIRINFSSNDENYYVYNDGTSYNIGTYADGEFTSLKSYTLSSSVNVYIGIMVNYNMYLSQFNINCDLWKEGTPAPVKANDNFNLSYTATVTDTYKNKIKITLFKYDSDELTVLERKVYWGGNWSKNKWVDLLTVFGNYGYEASSKLIDYVKRPKPSLFGNSLGTELYFIVTGTSKLDLYISYVNDSRISKIYVTKNGSEQLTFYFRNNTELKDVTNPSISADGYDIIYNLYTDLDPAQEYTIKIEYVCWNNTNYINGFHMLNDLVGDEGMVIKKYENTKPIILFCGDSITAASCAVDIDVDETIVLDGYATDKAFGKICANLLNAQPVLYGYPQIGVDRNAYNADNAFMTISKCGILAKSVLPKANLVVLEYGANDNCTDDVFIARMLEIIDYLRVEIGNCPIILLEAHKIKTNRTLLADIAAQRENCYTVLTYQDNFTFDTSADGLHPSVSGHQQLGEYLAAKITEGGYLNM